ncbi:TetR/AcrR family transcriptional regulator [Homoserinimonas sp. A447]
MTVEKDGAKPARPRGRRGGGTDSRAEIVAAASREFIDHGYDATSFRGIARRAGVDAALVHHYFADKAELFTETVQAPIRPDKIVSQILQGPRDQVGDSLVRMLLSTMEAPKTRDRVIGLIRTALGHDFAATMLRQFLFREVFHRIAEGLGVPDGELRATLAATQIVGLMVVRYGVRAEPLASESVDEVARRVGPVIQWHLTGYPGDLSIDNPAGHAE